MSRYRIFLKKDQVIYTKVKLNDTCKIVSAKQIINSIKSFQRNLKIINVVSFIPFIFSIKVGIILFLFNMLAVKNFIRSRCTVKISYVFDDRNRKRYQLLKDALADFTENDKLWFVCNKDWSSNRKFNFGEEYHFDLEELRIKKKFPEYIEIDQNLFCLRNKNVQIYFTPANIVLVRNHQACFFDYPRIKIKTQEVILPVTYPQNNKEVYSSRWKYSNLDGSRDYRFNDNYLVDNYCYGYVGFEYESGNVLWDDIFDMIFSDEKLCKKIQNDFSCYLKDFDSLATRERYNKSGGNVYDL